MLSFCSPFLSQQSFAVVFGDSQCCYKCLIIHQQATSEQTQQVKIKTEAFFQVSSVIKLELYELLKACLKLNSCLD